ncbi:MAG: hypothetical protein RDV48_26910 [Candidatus Eremiobacteraeota bacterium]|nr:hypothetical protein [Candidatus Eremiobacteraeota bacterium]
MDKHFSAFFFKRKRPSRNEGGAALATVLMVIFLMMMISFVLAGTSVFHMSTVQREGNAARARNMAESVIAIAIESVMKDVYYGTSGNTGYTDIVQARDSTGSDSAVGLLAFSDTRAKDVVNPVTGTKVCIPWSLNNIKKDTSANGCGRTVPKNGLHLVGTGICNGTVRQIETIIHVPQFPYVIASSGKFQSSGGLLVTAVKKMEDASAGADKIKPDNVVPGHLASNSTADSTGDKAITLGKETKVTGNVQSSGGVKVDADGGTEIQGETRTHADPVPLPKIDITQYNFSKEELPYVEDLKGSIEGMTIEGYCRSKGDLTVTGDLKLDGAKLYVDGDLHIFGGLKGKGGVFVTGKTIIEKGSSLDTDNMAVLAGKGDVSICGNGKDKSAFQGVVYTEGNFLANNITLMGSFLTNAPEENTTAAVGTTSAPAQNGSMEISNADLVEVPQYTKVKIPIVSKITVATTTTSASAYGVSAYQVAGPWINQQISVSGPHGTYIAPMSNFWTGTGFAQYAHLCPGYYVSAFGTGWSSWVCYNAFMGPVNWEAEINAAAATANAIIASANAQFQIAYQAAIQKAKEKAEAEAQEITTVAEEDADRRQVGTFEFDINQFLNVADNMRVTLWKEYQPQ